MMVLLMHQLKTRSKGVPKAPNLLNKAHFWNTNLNQE